MISMDSHIDKIKLALEPPIIFYSKLMQICLLKGEKKNQLH